jgi:hypothetical protein
MSSPALAASRNTVDRVLTVDPRYVDNDGDGYDDGPEETPAPGSETPGSDAPPNPDGVPLPDQVPIPVPLMVNIIGTFGPGAFLPNPLQAIIGDTIVWMNGDVISHVIVLDDGTPVGTLLPGQASLPIPIATETMGYHCTLHPSMVGQVTTVLPGIPAEIPADPSQGPVPDPSGYTPPESDPYDYDDGYGDGYYLKPVR